MPDAAENENTNPASRDNRLKKRLSSGRAVGEEITKEQAEEVISNKSVGGRRATIIYRTQVIETAPEKTEAEKRKSTPVVEEVKEPERKPVLCLVREDTGEIFELTEDMTVGRAEDNDIVIPGPEGHYVSRHHAVIHIQGKDIKLEDLDSTSGTYVNERKIRSKRIWEGNKVEFGDILFKVIKS